MAARKSSFAGGAGSTGAMKEIMQYADTIRGKPKEELIRRSTTIDIWENYQNEAFKQRFGTSCVPSVQMMMRAEADPVYAWRMHEDGIRRMDGVGFNFQESRRILQEAGGRARPDGDLAGSGLDDGAQVKVFNDIGKFTNKTYALRNVDDTREARRAALHSIEGRLRNGEDVPGPFEAAICIMSC